ASIPPPAPPPSALPYDTLGVPAGVPPSSRRWVMMAGIIGLIALLATIALSSLLHRAQTPPPARLTLTPPVETAEAVSAQAVTPGAALGPTPPPPSSSFARAT